MRTRLIIETNPTWLLRMVQLHFRLMQLGLPRTMEGQDIIAVIISFDSRTLARLQEMRETKRIMVENTAAAGRRASPSEPSDEGSQERDIKAIVLSQNSVLHLLQGYA